MKKWMSQIVLFLFFSFMLFFYSCAQTGLSGSRSMIVSLDGANEYEVVEAFGKIIHATRGVVEARTLSQSIVPNNPQECKVKWQVKISSETDTFRLQTNILKVADDVLAAEGYTKINGIPFRYSPSEIQLLMGLVPASTTSQSIRFVIDRDKARARKLSGGWDKVL